MFRDGNEIGNAKKHEQFSDDVAAHFFKSIDTFKKADKAERDAILRQSLAEAGVSAEDSADVEKFIALVAMLEGVTRTGWNKKPEKNDITGIKERFVDNPEDVALHTYGLMHLCLLAAQERPELNVARLIKLVTSHDIAEKITGDLVTAGKINEAELLTVKAELEKQAMEEICGSLEKNLGDELRALWVETEQKSSAEAQLVKQIDKLEAIIQAYNYSLVPTNKVDPQEFIDSTRSKITDPGLRGIHQYVERLNQQRNQNTKI